MTEPAANPMVSRILVANRGEIARRIMATVRRMGLQTVAVHSDPDADSPHVRDADFAVALPGRTSTQTYLNADAIIEAAQRSGADAVHPGYGFLSENADFAEAVETAGLTWIGPTPHSIRQMAYKIEAKQLAAEAGVPLVPGAELPDDLTDDEVCDRVNSVGFPLLIKASAGGGGKGMRVVERLDDVVDAVEAARREARSAFGDGTVFAERFVQPSRHIEVQVFGDQQGHVVHLFERECSIQRRHQKIVEESPAARLSAATADRMYAAATALARVIGYVGAGTVEFLTTDNPANTADGEEFFFLEMNTRLQVEHPVTEAVTGLDLVEWQIRVARGEALPLTQGEITRSGHAIEVRLYAEDPANGYLPNTGTVSRFDIDPVVRVDSGVEAGTVISSYYDPMLAKVIAHSADRSTAARVLTRALATAQIGGVITNRDSLVAICRSDDFIAVDTTTDFLERHPDLLDPPMPQSVIDRHLIAAVVWASHDHDVPTGWSTVPMPAQLDRFASLDDRARFTLATRWQRDGLAVTIHESEAATAVETYAREGRDLAAVQARILDADTVFVSIDGIGVPVMVHLEDDIWCISDGEQSSQWRRLPRHADTGLGETSRGPSTPVPGTVTMVNIGVGDHVEAGDCLVVLEAMKMEHRIIADAAGVIAEVRVAVGDSVDAHTVVAVLEGSSPDSSAKPSGEQ